MGMVRGADRVIRVDAWARLAMLDLHAKPPKTRKTTRPTYGSIQRRLQGKAKPSKIKVKAPRQGKDLNP